MLAGHTCKVHAYCSHSTLTSASFLICSNKPGNEAIPKVLNTPRSECTHTTLPVVAAVSMPFVGEGVAVGCSDDVTSPWRPVVVACDEEVACLA